MYSRKRKYTRISVRHKTHVELGSLDGKNKKKAMILNICEGGLLLKTTGSLEKRSFWNIKMFLFDDGPPILCRGRVLHIQSLNDKDVESYTIGLRFHELSEEDLSKVRMFLESQSELGTKLAENKHAVS